MNDLLLRAAHDGKEDCRLNFGYGDCDCSTGRRFTEMVIPAIVAEIRRAEGLILNDRDRLGWGTADLRPYMQTGNYIIAAIEGTK